MLSVTRGYTFLNTQPHAPFDDAFENSAFGVKGSCIPLFSHAHVLSGLWDSAQHTLARTVDGAARSLHQPCHGSSWCERRGHATRGCHQIRLYMRCAVGASSWKFQLAGSLACSLSGPLVGLCRFEHLTETSLTDSCG